MTHAGPARSARRRAILAGSFGNLVEWYDWGIYGLLAKVFSEQFFPAHDPSASLALTLLTFALGFIVRPLGAIILSPLGDRLGRRRLMGITVLGMGAGSLIIAVTPGYGVIGPLAPFILLLARCVQGVSAGAEFGASSSFLVEHAPPRRRGVVGSLMLVSIGLGTLLGSATAAAVTSWIPAGDLADWGWRLPFAFGALLGLAGLYLRTHVDETPEFVAAKESGNVVRRPLIHVLRNHPKESLRVIGMSVGGTVCFYLWTIYMPTYGSLVGGVDLSTALLVNVGCLIGFVVLLPFIGWLSDNKLGRRPLLIIESVGFVVLAYPLFRLVNAGGLVNYIIASVIGVLLLTMIESILATVYCEQFPPEVRSTGIGVPYAVATAIFGGTAPLIATWLVGNHLPMGIAFLVIAVQLVSAVVFVLMKETAPIKTGETRPVGAEA
jgi:MHS family alpha-ketoglutarate permease-like MFS transporter